MLLDKGRLLDGYVCKMVKRERVCVCCYIVLGSARHCSFKFIVIVCIAATARVHLFLYFVVDKILQDRLARFPLQENNE